MKYKTHLVTLFMSAVISYSFIITYLLNYLGVPSNFLHAVRIGIAFLMLPLGWTLINKINCLLQEYNPQSKKKIIICAGFWALLLQFAVPLNVPQQSIIEITATGNKDTASLGSEVWINGIEVDGKRLQFKQMIYDHNTWEERQDTLVSYQNQPATVEWKGLSTEKIMVNLVQHPYSGEAQVNINGTVTKCNLYAVQGTAKQINININPDKWKSKAQWINFIVNVMFLWLIFLFIMLKLIKENGIIPIRYAIVKKSLGLFVYVLPFLVVWGGYVLVFYPGIMSPDSFDQWKQITGRHVFNTAHPLFHTLFNWLITRVWLSPAAIASVQVTFMAFIVGYALKTLAEFGVNKVRLILLILFFAGMPIFGIFGSTLWKDIPYSVSLLWLTILLTKIYITDADFLRSRRSQLIISFVLLLVSQFRHEGLIASIIAVTWLYFVYKNKRKEVLCVCLVFLLLSGLFRLSSTLAFHPQPPPLRFQATQILVQPMSHIAAGLNAGWLPSYEDRQIVEGAMPRSVWIDKYDKYNVDSLIFNSFLDLYFIKENQVNFYKVWLDLFIEKPGIILEAWGNLNSLCWKILQPADGYQSVTLRETDYKLYKGELGTISSASFFPIIKSSIIKFHFATNNPTYSWFLWRPAVYFYLTWFLFIGLVFRNKWKCILPIMPVTIQVLLMLLLIPLQDVRYLFSVFLICPFLIVFTTCFKNKTTELKKVGEK